MREAAARGAGRAAALAVALQRAEGLVDGALLAQGVERLAACAHTTPPRAAAEARIVAAEAAGAAAEAEAAATAARRRRGGRTADGAASAFNRRASAAAAAAAARAGDAAQRRADSEAAAAATVAAAAAAEAEARAARSNACGGTLRWRRCAVGSPPSSLRRSGSAAATTERWVAAMTADPQWAHEVPRRRAARRRRGADGGLVAERRRCGMRSRRRVCRCPRRRRRRRRRPTTRRPPRARWWRASSARRRRRCCSRCSTAAPRASCARASRTSRRRTSRRACATLGNLPALAASSPADAADAEAPHGLNRAESGFHASKDVADGIRRPAEFYDADADHDGKISKAEFERTRSEKAATAALGGADVTHAIDDLLSIFPDAGRRADHAEGHDYCLRRRPPHPPTAGPWSRSRPCSSGRERVLMAHEWFHRRRRARAARAAEARTARADRTASSASMRYAAGGAAYRAQAAAALKVNQRAPLWPADKVDANTAAEDAVWRKEPLPDGDGAADAIDEAWRATRKRYPVPPRRSPPIGIEMGGAELKGAADYLGVYRLVEGLRINDRPACATRCERTGGWRTMGGTRGCASPSACSGNRRASSSSLLRRRCGRRESRARRRDAIWSAAVDGGWLDEPTLRTRSAPTRTSTRPSGARRRWRRRATSARASTAVTPIGAPEPAAPSPSWGLESHVLAFGHAPWAVWRSAGSARWAGSRSPSPRRGCRTSWGSTTSAGRRDRPLRLARRRGGGGERGGAGGRGEEGGGHAGHRRAAGVGAGGAAFQKK